MSLRVAVIGCGAIAEEMHLPALSAHPDVRLVALVDPEPGRARLLADRHGVASAILDFAELDSSIDAVVVCTPPHARPALVAQALSKGLHVLSEKPLANSVAECEAMRVAAARTQRVLAVSHMFRFYPVRARLHALVELHDLGKINEVEISEGAPYAWNVRSGYTFKRGEVSGGVLINAGIHSLDSLIQWFGEPSIEAYEDDALGGLESNARAKLSFASGITAKFRISRTCRLPSLFQIRCERGTIVFSNRDTVNYQVEKQGATTQFQCDGERQTPADCWHAQLDDFLACIREGRRPMVDGAEASRVVSVVEQMYRLKRARMLPTNAPIPGMTW